MKIIGASVVFVCDREFSIIRDGGVAYEGERIVEVGVYDELVAKYTKSPTAKRSFFRKQGIPLGDSRCFFRKQATAVQGVGTQAGFFRKQAKRCERSEADFFRTPRILEEEKEAECGNSCREQVELESSFEKSRDCGANAPSPSLRDTAEAVAWQSTLESTFEKVDSSTAQIPSLRGDEIAEAKQGAAAASLVIHKPKSSNNAQNNYSASAESMDCHAANAARNDRNNAAQKADSSHAARRQDCENEDSGKQTQTLSNSAKDSRISKETSANAERCPLFCDEKSVFSSDWQGSYLEGNDRRQSRRIADLSRKAESTSQAESPQTEFFSGCVLLPALINAHIHFEFSSNSTSFVYGSFEGWLASVMSKRDDVLADMDKAIESTIEEQLDSGVGSVGAISSYGADMQALAQSALKVVYCSEAIGANPAALDMLLADFKARFLAARELASRSFFPAIALHAPYSVHSVLAKHIIAFAKEAFSKHALESTRPTHTITNPCETSCTFSAHFLESNAERLWLESKNDADAPKGWFYDFYTQTLKIPRPAPYYTPQEFMELFSSMRTSFVHCTALNSLESTFLAHAGHSLITCPRSNRLLDGSMLDLKKLDSRQNLGIGTDGASSNANTCMLDELRAGLFGMGGDLQDLARVLLLAATRGGAKALGLANGTLESGRSADMAVFAIKGIADSTQPEVHFILLANKVHRLLINGEQVR